MVAIIFILVIIGLLLGRNKSTSRYPKTERLLEMILTGNKGETMPVYIKGYGPVGPTIQKHLGQINGEYLKSYDPDAFDGYGDCVFTDLPEDALAFSSFTDAQKYVNQVSKKRPLREDGQPNRPIAAFTIEMFIIN